jgi:hypothetical protein
MPRRIDGRPLDSPPAGSENVPPSHLNHTSGAPMILRASLPLLILFVPSAAAPAAGPIKDPNLEAAVRGVLHFPTGDLTDEKLKGVFILKENTKGKGIKDLTGLEKCPNLAEFYLEKNEIVDLKPLAGLTNLQSLVLTNNKIKDVSPLANLKGLQLLDLTNNEVEKIDSLAGLPALTSLYLTGNKIADCAPAAKLTKLWSLHLGKNQIKDISPLGALTKVSTVEIADNPITDIAALGKMTELHLLMMSKCKVTDLTPLVKSCEADASGPKRFAPYLQLYLGGNPLSDAAKKDQIAALKKVGVRVFEE